MRTDPGRLDLAKLQVFLEVSRQGSCTAAARRLHVTQSAVSHAIRKLEDGLGTRLVAWPHRRFALTDEGEYLRRVCEQVFRDLGEADRVLAEGGPDLTQVVTVGATVEFGTTVVVRKLRPLLDRAPWLRLHFRFGDDLTQALLRDDVDLAVDCRPHIHPTVQATPLFREKYLIVASPGFLATHPVRRIADLERVPVLSLDAAGAWWGHVLRAFAGRERPVLGRIVEINQVHGMLHAALEGYGVALLPKYVVQGKVRRGDLTALFPRMRLLEDWFCVYQKSIHAGREKNRVVTDFLRQLDMSEFGDAIRRPRPAGRRASPHHSRAPSARS